MLGIVPTIKKLTENRVHPSSRQRGWGTRAAIYAIVSRDGGGSTEAPQAETSSFRARGRDRPAASTFLPILLVRGRTRHPTRRATAGPAAPPGRRPEKNRESLGQSAQSIPRLRHTAH